MADMKSDGHVQHDNFFSGWDEKPLIDDAETAIPEGEDGAEEWLPGALDRDDDEEELEESSEEEETSDEEESEEETPEEKKPIVEETVPQEVPVDYNTALNYYETQWMIHELQKNADLLGIAEVTVENLNDVANLAFKTDPTGFQEIRDWVKNKAKEEADKYEREKIVPYNAQVIRVQVQEFVKDFAQEFPDVASYLPKMKQLQAEFFKKNPKFSQNPVLAIPMLYAKAKEAKLGKVVSEAKQKRQSETALERGNSRKKTTPTAKRTRGDKEPPPGQLFTSRREDPLKGIFN